MKSIFQSIMKSFTKSIVKSITKSFRKSIFQSIMKSFTQSIVKSITKSFRESILYTHTRGGIFVANCVPYPYIIFGPRGTFKTENKLDVAREGYI